MKVYAYEKCDTCRKAIKYLQGTKHAFTVHPIRETPPSPAELRSMLKIYEGKLGKLFNSSGRDYKEMKIADKLPGMSVDKAITLLSANGNLVKRPFVLAGNTGVVGFRLDEWKRKGLR